MESSPEVPNPTGDPRITNYEGPTEVSRVVKTLTCQVLEILRLRREGVTLEKLAGQFGVGGTQIHRICTGKKWKHLG